MLSSLAPIYMTLAEFEPYMVYIWLALFAIFVIVESCTIDLVCVWFALGSLVSLFVALIPGCPFWAEILIFAFVSGLTLGFLRPLTRKYLNKRKADANTNVDSLLGKEIVLTKEASEFELGETKLSGVTWSVRSKDPKTSLPKGSVATIVALEGNKLVAQAKENK